MGRKQRDASATAAGIELCWGAQQLERPDDRPWSDLIRPVLRDTAQLPQHTIDNIGQIDTTLATLIGEYRRHRLPAEIVSMGAWSLRGTNPLTFMSYLVGQRAERLIQCLDLAANAVTCLLDGALLPAAASARSALEIAAMSMYVQLELDKRWTGVHGDEDRIRRLVMDEDERLWKVLVSVRVGSTLTDDPAGGDWPKPKHVNDAFRAVPRFDRELGHLMDVAYSRLCEAVHPSVGAQAALWRLGGTGRLQPYVLRLEPRRSQSPTKVDVVAAVFYSAFAVTQFARFLWWVATDVSLAFRTKNVAGSRRLGLPIAGKRGAPCVCGSGVAYGECEHPKP